MSPQAKNVKPIWPIAVFVAWLVPGAGHLYLGRRVRGVVILVTVAALFWSGVAVGGVMTVDAEAERWWFVADMFSGTHGLVGWYRSQQTIRRQVLAVNKQLQAGDAQAQVARIPVKPPAHPGERARRRLLLEAQLAKEKLALVSPTDTVARTYAGVAGLLNLMCIFDVLILSLLGVTGEDRREQDATGGAKR